MQQPVNMNNNVGLTLQMDALCHRPRRCRILPPPAENAPRRRRQIMWRAAESAAIEERRRRNLCGSPDFFAIFSHPPRQSDSGHRTIHRRARLLTIAPCTVDRYTSNCSYSLVIVRFYTKPYFRFHID